MMMYNVWFPGVMALMGASLAGCNVPAAFDPTLSAAVYCVLAEDGTVAAQGLTEGGARATSDKLSGVAVVTCDGATKLGAAFSARK